MERYEIQTEESIEHCPFDNGKAILELVQINDPFTFTDLYYQVRCTVCGLTKGRYRIPYLPQFCKEDAERAMQAAIDDWNRRA